MIDKLSDSKDLVRQYTTAYTDLNTDKSLEMIPEAVRPDFANHIFTAQFWKRVEDTHIPLDMISERKGSWDKDSGENRILEYFKEDYTLQELNRLFPGWYMKKMKSKFYNEIRMVEVKGYLVVEVPTLQGKIMVQRWATGTAVIEFKTDDKTQASQPDDRFKAARTEWIKLAGKLYGIGLEIYHQRVTPELRSHFEDIIRPLGAYADNYKKIVETIETGHGFRNYLKELPTITQVKRIIDACNKIPEDLMKGDAYVRQLIMKNFVLNNNGSDSNRVKFEEFIKAIEHTAAQYEDNNKSEGDQ